MSFSVNLMRSQVIYLGSLGVGEVQRAAIWESDTA